MAAPKKKNESVAYSEIDRFRKAAGADWPTFMEKMLCIVNKKGIKQRLTPNSSQRKIAQAVQDFRKDNRSPRIYVLKGRQRGISTWTSGFTFSEAYNNDNASAITLTHLNNVSTELLNKMKYFYDNLPGPLQMPYSRCNELEIGWKHNNSSVLIGSADNLSVIHGRTVRQLHCSEISRYKDLEEFLKGATQAVPNDPIAWIILESTANGMSHYSYELWKEAERKKNKFLPIFLRWFEDEDALVAPFKDQHDQDTQLDQAFAEYPELKERMKRYLLPVMGAEEACRRILWYYDRWLDCHRDNDYCAQEYPCDPEEAFIASGNPFFSMAVVNKQRLVTRPGTLYDPTIPFTSLSNLTSGLGLIRDREPYLEIFERPIKGRKYLLSADAAMGLSGRDSSAGVMFDEETGNTVAVIHGIMEVTPFADALIALSDIYNFSQMAPEAKGNGGSALMEVLKIRKFPRLWRRRKQGPRGWELASDFGWDTNLSTRPAMLNHAKHQMRERVGEKGDKAFLPCVEVLDQMKTFVEDTHGKNQASKGNHDDLLMAWCIGNMVCQINRGSGQSPTGLITMCYSKPRDSAAPLTVEDTLRLIQDEQWTGQSHDDFFRRK